MKVIIAGKRSINDDKLVYKVIKESGFEITEVICGMCTGVDLIGANYAKEHNIPINECPAQWDLFGVSAGPIRNELMAQKADALILIHSYDSKGSYNMLQTAIKYNLKIHEHII